MAAHNKENLRKLLNFLNAEIIHKPENHWFVEELRKSLPRDSVNEGSVDSPSISKIEKYLALDYNLDDTKTALDYSSIKNDYLRECFEADCREMLRFRFGLRGHRIDFGEFCRFVQIQAERLLNVYYQSKGSISQIRSYIKQYNPTAVGLEKCTTLENISYSVKLWAYSKEHSLKPLYDILDKVRKVRNTHSHGSAQSADEIFFQAHYAMLLQSGYPLLSNCLVDWSTLDKDELKNDIYVNTIRDTIEHKHYIDLCWQRRQPFDEVIMALEVLILHVSNHID
ncbi:MAG: hypothetical protein HDR89_03260 [Bacteroides sp.]|nr:hypothetical protein [Bacteroides sp.]MBD5349885.1 hypothetical protein [Bacteroides sp.]